MEINFRIEISCTSLVNVYVQYIFFQNVGMCFWVWINTSFHTIFRGMNIHESQLFWCELQGYKVLILLFHHELLNTQYTPYTGSGKILRPVGTRSVRSVTASATARSSAWPGRRCWAPRSIRCCRCWTPTGSRGAVGEAWWVGRLGKWGGSMFPNSSGVDGGKLNQQCWGHHLCSHKLQSWISSRLRLRSVGMLSHVEPCWTTCNCWLKHHMQTLETIGIRRD